MAVKHAFTSQKSDGADATLVRPSDWNASHTGNSLPSLLVAATNASADVKSAADYLCDGTADEVQINAAINALPTTGGCVQLSGGTFTLATPVLITDHGIILQGIGYGDPVGWSSTGPGTALYPSTGFTGGSLIVVATGTFMASYPVAVCQIKNLMCDGSGGTTTPRGSGIDGIQFSSFSGLIQNVRTALMSGDGIHIAGTATPSGWATYETRVDGVLTHNNNGRGLFCDAYGGDMQISNIVAYSNKMGGIETSGASTQFALCHLYGNGDGGGTDGSTYGNLKIASGDVRSKFVSCKFEHAEGKYGIINAGWETLFSACSFHSNGEKWENPTTTGVTFQDSGDTVSQTDHRLANGDAVQFSAISGTTGISINTTYYVISRASNTFQVSSTVGGSALALTGNGTGTLVRSDGGAGRAQLYNSGSMMITGCKFAIKGESWAIGASIECSSGGGGVFVAANEFQTGNCTSGWWNGSALNRNGAVYDPGSKATIRANKGIADN